MSRLARKLRLWWHNRSCWCRTCHAFGYPALCDDEAFVAKNPDMEDVACCPRRVIRAKLEARD